MLIAIVLGICACISPIISNIDIVNADSTPIVNSLNAPTGTTNDTNPFLSLTSLWTINKGNNWSRVYNYYNDSNMEYTFNGIQMIGDRYFVNAGGDVWYYCLDLEFSVPVQFNRASAFSIILHRSALLNTQLTSQYTLDGVNWLDGVTSVYSDGEQVIATIYPNTVSASARIFRLHFDIASSQNTPLFIASYYGTMGGQSAYDSGYQIGLQEGYTNGYNAGVNYANSNINTNSASYQAGYNQGSLDSSNLFELFSSAVSAPVNVLMDTFNFEILGVNVSTFILSLLTLGFIVIIIRLLI